MDPLTGYLIIFAVGWILRSAVHHARQEYRRSRESELEAAEQEALPKRLGPSVRRKVIRQHRTGWWASEVSRGFPVHRTGMHAGWLAHQATAMQTRAQREAARTMHLDATASFASAVKDHRERQKAIRDEIEESLAASPVMQDGSRKAVKDAAGAVVYDLDERRRPAAPGPAVPVTPFSSGPFASYDPSAMDRAWSENWRIGDRRAEAHPDDSSHLRPGEPRCEACDGTGSDGTGRPGVEGACTVCRGWGSAAPDPATLTAAPEGTVCGACGRHATPGDPVLIERAGSAIHRSHATEARERYERGMASLPRCELCEEPLRLRAHDGSAHLDCDAADRKAAEIDDAVMEVDQVPIHPKPPAEGAPPVTDTTFSSVLQTTRAAVAQADVDTHTIGARKAEAYRIADEMIAANVDPAVINAQMTYADHLAEAEKHLAAAGQAAGSTHNVAVRYHGGMQEATDNAPGKVAERSFHEGG